jgi:hypothetical protein
MEVFMMIQNALDLLNHLANLEEAMALVLPKNVHDELLIRLVVATLDKKSHNS